MRALAAVRQASVTRGEKVLVGGAASVDGVAVAAVVKNAVAAETLGIVNGVQERDLAMGGKIDFVVDRQEEKVSVVIKDKVRVAFDCVGEGKRIAQIVKKRGVIVRMAEAMSTGMKKVNELVVDKQVERKHILAAQAVVKEWDVRVPYGPRFGLGEFLNAIKTAEHGVGAGKVVIVL